MDQYYDVECTSKQFKLVTSLDDKPRIISTITEAKVDAISTAQVVKDVQLCNYGVSNHACQKEIICTNQ